MQAEKTKSLNKTVKIVMVSLFAAVLVGVCIFVIKLCLDAKSGVPDSFAAVYKKDNVTVVNISGDKLTIDRSDCINIDYSEKTKRLFCLVPSAVAGEGNEVYDLVYTEYDKQKSALKDLTIIDIGVAPEYFISDDGNFVYYRKYNGKDNAFEGTVCALDSNSITSFASNVNELFVFTSDNTVYFTRPHADSRVLYRFDGDKMSEICRNIVSVNLYNNCDNPHIIFESLNDDGYSKSLFIADTDGNELISDSVAAVLYDEYLPHSNLYYFSSDSQEVSWSQIISDNYLESDEALERPVREDYVSVYGGTASGYIEALEAYQDKMIRDEIRQSLDTSFADGTLIAPIYTAYAYTGEEIYKLADSVNPEYVYAAEAYGTPRIIYESTVIEGEITDISTLVNIAARSDLDDVIAYACNLIGSAVLSEGLVVSCAGAAEPYSCSLEDFNKSTTLFNFFGDSGDFFAFERDKTGDTSITFNSVNPDTAKLESVSVEKNASSYCLFDDELVYLTLDVGKNSGDVYSFSNGKKIKIFNAANAFFRRGDGIITVKNYTDNNGKAVAEYYLIKDGEQQLLSNNVLTDSFFTDSDMNAVFLRQTEFSTELILYGNGSFETLDTDVEEILVFK